MNWPPCVQEPGPTALQQGQRDTGGDLPQEVSSCVLNTISSCALNSCCICSISSCILSSSCYLIRSYRSKIYYRIWALARSVAWAKFWVASGVLVHLRFSQIRIWLSNNLFSILLPVLIAACAAVLTAACETVSTTTCETVFKQLKKLSWQQLVKLFWWQPWAKQLLFFWSLSQAFLPITVTVAIYRV